MLAELSHILGRSGAGAHYWKHWDGHFPTHDLNACLVICHYTLPVTDVVTHPQENLIVAVHLCQSASPATHTGLLLPPQKSSYRVEGGKPK